MAMDMTTALTIQAKVVGQNQIGGLTKGLGGLTTQTNKAQGAMGRLKIAAGGALTALRNVLPVLGVAAVAGFAKKNLEAADQMSKLSKRTGIAAPMLDKFRQAAELSDTSIQSLEKAFPNLARGIDDAVVKGTGPAAEAFNRLGIGLTDAEGKVRDTDQVMLDLADRFQQMPDGTEKAALASQIFGQRLGSELIPMLNEGGDSVRNMSTALTQDFADKAAGFNDKVTKMGEKLGQLGMKITEALLPFLNKLVDGISFLAKKFAALPGPVQGVIVAIGGIAGVALVFAPIVAAVTTLGPLMLGLLPIIAKVAVAAAAVKALTVVFGAVKDAVVLTAQAFNTLFVQPVIKGGQAVFDGLVQTLGAIGDALRGPFEAAANMIKGVVNGILNGIGNAIGSVIRAINNVIRGANAALRRLKLPQIPLLPTPNIPQFAKGGMVTGPTLGLVGEAGPEYIVPARKAQGFAQNIMNGVRGPGAIPRFAEGGFVSPSASVNIQTGPVTQMNGQNFVTAQDMSAAVQAGVEQTLQLIQQDGMIRAGMDI